MNKKVEKEVIKMNEEKEMKKMKKVKVSKKIQDELDVWLFCFGKIDEQKKR